MSAPHRPAPARAPLAATEALVAPDALARARAVGRVLDEAAPPPEELDAARLNALYRQLCTLRAVSAALSAPDAPPFGVPARVAAIVGAVAALAPEDWLFPDPDDHGALLVRGASLASYLAQVAGTAADPAKGRAGPAQPARRSLNVLAVGAPLGMHLSHAMGAAWAARLRGDPVVVMATCGTRATSGDEFHVALNFAALRRAPVVFVCHTTAAELRHETAAESVAVKGLAYDVPGVRADGGDLLAMYAACRAALARARGGGGPSLVEAVVEGAAGEAAPGGRRDPLARLERYLVARGVLAPEDAAALGRAAAAEVAAAQREAAAAAPLAPETLVEDVYATVPWHLREQSAALGDPRRA